MVEGESGILSICPNSNRPTYEPSKRRLTWPNGVIATMFSSWEPEQSRPSTGRLGATNLARGATSSETWSMLQFGLRLGKRPRQVITTTPKRSSFSANLSRDMGKT